MEISHGLFSVLGICDFFELSKFMKIQTLFYPLCVHAFKTLNCLKLIMGLEIICNSLNISENLLRLFTISFSGNSLNFCPNYFSFKRYNQKCTLPFLSVLMITSFLAEVNFKWVCPESHRQKTWKPKNVKTRCTQVGIWRISRFHQYRNGHKHLLVSSPECSKYQVLWSRLHEEREKLKLVSIYKRPLLYCYCMHYHHCVKWVQIRSFFSSVFSGIRTKIQSECGKIRTRKNSVFGHFSSSAWCITRNTLRQNANSY